MRTVNVDFAPRSVLPERIAIGVALIGFAVAIVQVHSGMGERKKTMILDEEARVLRAQGAASAPVPPLPKVPPYAEDAAAIARAASYDFGAVLTALETVRLPNIKVTSIDIVPAEATARIELEFTDRSILFSYLEELNAGLPRESGKWRMVRAQMPTAVALGAATIVAPADIGTAAGTSPTGLAR